MFEEARSAGSVVERLLGTNAAALDTLADRLRADPPPVIITYARGSSDHAATYAKYLFEMLIGVPVSSGALSVASIYRSPVVSRGALCVAISQSGRSPDILAGVEAQKRAGNCVVALVNDETSPLATLADIVLPLCAGPECSVAATKSYIASLALLAMFAARLAKERPLEEGVRALPETLPRAFDLDWSQAIESLAQARNLFVLGRGYSLGIAQEAALKLKETCGLHAEAFSAAEVRHGPMAIVGEGFPILGFATSDTAGDGLCEVAADLAGRGAAVHLADPLARLNDGHLLALSAHPAIEPILMIQSFYRFANSLSLRRGFHPDAPPYLSKVTSTI
ncbi:SIS domain-containing protein [Sphingomonas koreensis]|nr:SIS domain-containing protein [Sphingomonas koreensis]